MLEVMCNTGGMDFSVSYDARSQQRLFVIMCQVRTRELGKKKTEQNCDNTWVDSAKEFRLISSSCCVTSF